MAEVTFSGEKIKINKELPLVGDLAPNFHLIKKDLTSTSLNDYGEKFKILNIFPSIDTQVCANSVKTFNEKSGLLSNTVILNISKDLPFAQVRFCDSFKIENVEVLSAFRSSFALDYGVELMGSKLIGLCARAIILLNPQNKVVYKELVEDIHNEPNYEAVLSELKNNNKK